MRLSKIREKIAPIKIEQCTLNKFFPNLPEPEEIFNIQGKRYIEYANNVDFIVDQGEWRFNLQDEKGLKRGDIFNNASEQELSDIIEWCYQHI